MAGLLWELKGIVGPLLGKGEVMQELEYTMRTKGNMTRMEEVELRAYSSAARGGFMVGAGLYSFLGWFMTGIGQNFPGIFRVPRMPGLIRFGAVSGGAFITGKVMYYLTLRICAQIILDNVDGEDRMKMELADIILTKHSDDKPLVEAVKRHFFAEHMFTDVYQDRPLFRWHPRRSYIDSAYVERLKEIEAEVNSSDDESRSISRQTTVNIRSFGDLMDDPLACILGSPGWDIESHNVSENTGAVLKRREQRNRRRSHRKRTPTNPTPAFSLPSRRPSPPRFVPHEAILNSCAEDRILRGIRITSCPSCADFLAAFSRPLPEFLLPIASSCRGGCSYWDLVRRGGVGGVEWAAPPIRPGEMAGGKEPIEVKFRLFDGTDIGPSKYDPATTVTALKEFVLARWPQDKEIVPKTVNDVKLINAGKILENGKTLAESRVPVGEVPGSVITMHVVVRPPQSNKSEKQQSNSPKQNRCGCTIL